MSYSISILNLNSSKNQRWFLGLALAFLILLSGGCGITKSIDDIVDEIERTRQTIAAESSGWREEVPKLVNDLHGMESSISADAKGILADTTNQVQDLATQTIQFSDAKAQGLISQAGAEFRCNADFVKAGAVAQLQSIVDDLKFWKLNKKHLGKKPNHAVCWVSPSALSLYPSGNNWLIDTTNMSDRNIVHVFGYNFWPEALPTLELRDASNTSLRKIKLTAAYVTHYQINLDFSTELFPDVKPGYRIAFNWTDLPDPNTINLTVQSSAKLQISNPVFIPSSPTALKDFASLQVTIRNQGGLRSGNFEVIWKPDSNDSRVLSVSRTPLAPGESSVVSLPGYVYQRGGTINSTVSLSNGDDLKTYFVTVTAPPSPEIRTCGPFGGGGGSDFDEPFKINPIGLVLPTKGDLIDSIQVLYADGQSARFGGGGGGPLPINFGVGEYVQGLDIRWGQYVDSLTIYTNIRSLGPYGGKGGTITSSCGGPGWQVIRIFGRAKQYVDALGAYLQRR